ncbi:hypothetical protein FFRU_160110 [Fructobacillus fructosus]|uniref:hypothetical protein n=1 Tax=Fructobacillus fructosus TaxID=1631 RepID=UPI0002194E82|nr:hypothetical protein [Fructobacillus fructosus]GAP01917.1 hypothetical protein FFRU_160110 [Fructobacillus fructosus]
MDFTQAQALLIFSVTIAVLFRKPLNALADFIIAHTKSKRMKQVAFFAKQSLAAAATSGIVTDQIKAQAINTLTARVQENGLGKHFTDEQIKFYIDQAIADSDKLSEQVPTK